MFFWDPYPDSSLPRPPAQVSQSTNPHPLSRFIQKGLMSLLLALLVGTDLIAGWPFTPPIAHAAPFQSFAASPGKQTLQQFLQQGQPDKAYHGPFGFPATSADKGKQAQTNTPSNRSAALPSAEPPKMQLISITLDSTFAASGTTLPAALTPVTPTPTVTTVAVTPGATKT